MRTIRLLPVLLLLLPLLPAGPGLAADEESGPVAPPDAWRETLQWRSIGPSNMGGRITALAVVESDPTRWWAATASGGLVRTTDDGITLEHQFDGERTVSIGDVAVAPSNPDVVWVGTGEANPRNSVSWGDGVYRSTDTGKTWTRMGLEKSFQIGAVVIHPEDPDVVYVGALGRLWGPNEERGLYKTTDGGKTWERILHVDADTGVVDVAMHPNDPETMLVATYQRRRDGFDVNDPAVKWGPGSGVWKTTDGGKTFRRLETGLPTRPLGRIGIAYSRSEPDIVYAVVETDWLGAEPLKAPYMGINGENADVGARLTRVIPNGPSAKSGLKEGDIILSMAGVRVADYQDFIRLARTHEAGDTVKMEIVRERKHLEIEVTFGSRPRPEGAKGPTRQRSMFAAGLGGQRENLQDQQGKQGHEFGGVFRSADGGETWARVNTLNPRPMYFSEVRVDPTDPKRVYVLGIRFWVSEDSGKTFGTAPARGVHVDHHALWIDPRGSEHMILGNDGGAYVTRDRGAHWDHLNHVAIGQFYHVGVGPNRDYRVYGGLQDNGSWGGPSRVRHGGGPANADWGRIGGGDGFVCRVDPDDPDLVYFASQYGGLGRWNLRTGERGSLRPRPPRGTRYRFNWNTPYVLSHHNGRIYYMAGNRVFRSLDRGRSLRVISPEITRTDRGTATALAESPRNPDALWVGTDDGALWRTRNGGHTWEDVFAPPEAKEETPPPGPGPRPSEESARSGGENGDAPNGGDGEEKPTATDAPSSAPRREAAGRLAGMMRRYDTDGDGRITRDEMPEGGRAFFDRVDANDDGVVDAAEMEAASRNFGGPRRGGGSGAPGRGERRRAAPKAPPGTPLATLVPDRRWVAWIEPSRFEDGRVYLVLDGHRSDDDRPLVFASEDHGDTWRSLRSNLPDGAGTTRVIREDLVNPDLLYLGTEMGAWASVDRGRSWFSLNTNLPTVAVHAFGLHPTAGEIVAATHGRSLWVLDVTVLRQMTREALAAKVRLYASRPAVHWRPEPTRGASRSFVGRNPPTSGAIWYSLKAKATSIALRLEALDGRLVRELEASAEPGLHRVAWDLREKRPEGRRARYGPRAKPGAYRIVLEVDGQKMTGELRLEMDPDHPDALWLASADMAEELEAERMEDKVRRRQPWRFRGED